MVPTRERNWMMGWLGMREEGGRVVGYLGSLRG